jgi:hypothetical protein
MSPRRALTLLAVAQAAVLVSWDAGFGPAAASSAQPSVGTAVFGSPRAPLLASPTGPIERVSGTGQLEAAVARLTSGTTILLAPGEYRLTSELVIRGVHDVAIRGDTGRPEDVVIRGSGMNRSGINVLVHVMQARDVLLADLSLGDVFYHPLQLHGEAGADRVRVYNVRLFDAGQQFIKASVDLTRPDGVDETTVEYSVFEYTRTGPQSGYTAGVDILYGANWQVRRNLFRNIRAPQGVPAAILAWNGARNIVTDRNTFIDCARAIVYGLQPQPEFGHSNHGGTISNNMIAVTPGTSGDAGISAWDSPNTRIVHNTVILNGAFPHAIEFRFPGTTGVEIVNNLTDGSIVSRDGGRAVLSGNATAMPDMFVSAATGDLHLTPRARAGLGSAVRLPNPGPDWDGDPRPAEREPDPGADQIAEHQP